ncbi:cell wall protein Lmo0130-like [Hylaeus volcanicus]|uniref:cell wall protein Lmo0130-like n=1 Tax=Hylaeus volcanicus TaxID=313075 RepID=UPI0023B7C495|nr:cell wall protein Lmo0130-like [Hylaeus volcanicus]XP_053971634.1 cell wall protein Lmo0130-like [Hylaeus volcanicus]
MKSLAFGWIFPSLLIAASATGGLNPEGVICGESRCSTLEYCNRYVKHCKPCSSICDVDSSNYQPVECLSDCQEYLHDKRYVLLEQYEDLRGQVGKLWILVSIAIAVAAVSLLTTLYLLTRKLTRWNKLRAVLRRAFTGNKIQRTSHPGNDNVGIAGGYNNNNNADNNNRKKNKAQDDVESGIVKQNGLRLAMPTISASVAPSRILGSGNGNGRGNGSGNANGNGSGSGNGSGIDNGTPNTTSTSLSGRHPSEDTTLDYAYDNPAMTPSPESVQIRTNRESSF